MSNGLPSSGRMDASDGGAEDLPYAGVELGGTKCVCTLASGPGRILDQQIVPTTSPEETLSAILEILHDWHRHPGFRALGVASFGPIELDARAASYGHILATTKAGWAGTDVLGTLSAPFAVPAGFDTDVNGAALAEIAWGCGKGMDDFAYVTVGTGVGVGLIVHGRPTRGFAHSELGHVRVPRVEGDMHPSVCGFHADCVEGLASGSALVSRLGGRHVRDVAADDPVWEPVVAYIAAMAHALVCATGPQRIAIGGGVVTAQPHLLDRVEAALRRSLNGYMQLPRVDGYVTPPALGDMAGPMGSIALAMAACAATT